MRTALQKSVVPVLIAGVFLILLGYSSPFVMDDAYISFTYSKNLAQGHGLTYNGMVVEGFSNPLWTILIAPFIWLHIDPLTGARFLAVVVMLATLYLTWQMAQRLSPHTTRLTNTVITLIVVTNIAVLSWTISGLETPLFTFLLILIVYLETHPTLDSPLPSALAVFALALTRPEGAMLIPIVLVYHGIRGGYSLKKHIVWIASIVIPFAVFILWRVAMYGYPLPNTAYVKVDPGGTTFEKGVQYVSSFFLVRPTLSVLLVLAGVILLRQGVKIARAWLLILAVVAAFIAFALYVGGDWMPFHRFLMPIVPLLALLVVPVLAFPTPHRWLRLLPQTLAVSTILLDVFFLVTFCGDFFHLSATHHRSLTDAGKWIQANTDPSTVIAVVDAGMLAYYSERTTIDIVGLNNVHIAHHAHKSDPQYVLSQKPALVQIHARQTDDGAWYDPDSTAGDELIKSDLFHQNYEPAQDPFVDFPIGRWFVRVTTPGASSGQ